MYYDYHTHRHVKNASDARLRQESLKKALDARHGKLMFGNVRTGTVRTPAGPVTPRDTRRGERSR